MKIERLKRPMAFSEIRLGTVFTCGDGTYIKGQTGETTIAVNLETGMVTEPTNSGLKVWEECYIYPHASMNLLGNRSRK